MRFAFVPLIACLVLLAPPSPAQRQQGAKDPVAGAKAVVAAMSRAQKANDLAAVVDYMTNADAGATAAGTLAITRAFLLEAGNGPARTKEVKRAIANLDALAKRYGISRALQTGTGKPDSRTDAQVTRGGRKLLREALAMTAGYEKAGLLPKSEVDFIPISNQAARYRAEGGGRAAVLDARGNKIAESQFEEGKWRLHLMPAKPDESAR